MGVSSIHGYWFKVFTSKKINNGKQWKIIKVDLIAKSITSIAWVGEAVVSDFKILAFLFRFSNILLLLIVNYQGHSSAIPGMRLGPITQGEENRTRMDSGLTCDFQQDIGFSSWGNVAESSSASYQSVDFQLSLPCTQSSAMSMMPGQDNELLDDVFTDEFMKKQDFRNHSDSMGKWQVSYV